jgi:hypothetical protein
MNYTLVKPDGTLGQTRDFDEAPILATNKGKWLPDNPPAFDPATHVRNHAAAQSVNAAEIIYLVTQRPAEELAAEAAEKTKREEIAQAKADARADAFVQQFMNMTRTQMAKYVTDTPEKQVLVKVLMVLQAIAKEQLE